jgi:broad specificity phosphatase PhoE
MRLYIVRHAEPDYSIDSLTPAGHREAQALAERMVKLAPTHLFSSPVQRARHTCQYTAQKLGVEPGIEKWTAELGQCRQAYEPWGGLCIWDCPGELVRARYPLPTRDNWFEMPEFSNPLYRESLEMVGRESDAFFTRFGYVREGGRYRIERPNQYRITLFCHGGFGLWWLAHLLEIPLPLVFSGFFLPPSSVTTVLFDERSKDWAVPRSLGMGDVSHLYAAGLPVSNSGVKANCE